MSTITKELAKLFRKITNSEIDAEGNAHVILSPADSLLINNARIALASLEAEAVAYMHHSGQVVTREECCDDKIFAICCKVETPLYAAPQLPQPAVLSVSEGVLKSLLPDVEKSEFWFEHNGKIFFEGVRFNNAVFEACRAAMLQAEPVSNSDELPLDYLQGHKDGLEWAAQLAEANHPQTGDWLYDDPIELARAIRKGPDMPEFKSESVDEDDNFYSWFGRFWYENYQKNNYTTSAKQMLGTMAEFAYRAGRESAALAGNSPVIPDGWIPVSERMPEEGQEIIVMDVKRGKVQSGMIYQYGRFVDFNEEYYEVKSPSHWMPLPAAPNQEVNRG
ncbi:DUF551 domain-containing protein [Citrobacter portucalensis]|uniref:DUF551 domain-containing protein n=1 Tax=Citrobacter portucalensis TaxID=1639133 RepID=UPI00374E847C